MRGSDLFSQYCSRIRGARRAAVVVAMLLLAATAAAAADPASALHARYAALTPRLAHSPFPQRLLLDSAESPSASQGDIYAVVDYRFATVAESFRSPAHWCDALILHLNVKYCRATPQGGGTVLSVAIGRKHEEPLNRAFRVEFVFDASASTADYLGVGLDATQGPLGTGNYRIALEAVPLDDAHTFVHLRYAYTYGLQARVALGAYLATTGAGKVGFTAVAPVDSAANPAAPALVGGIRGAIERNTMRYFLAIDSYLGALGSPPAERFEQSLLRWFRATERYPRQLHEVDLDSYLAMKRSEYQRQQRGP